MAEQTEEQKETPLTDALIAKVRPGLPGLPHSGPPQALVTPEQIERLKTIHPEGVCDYSRPDAGRPANL